MAFPLIIAVYSIVTVISYSVGVETGTILKDWSTISSCSTGIVYVLLKLCITHPSIADAVISSYRRGGGGKGGQNQYTKAIQLITVLKKNF